MNAITETTLPLLLFRRGKVRDTYDLGDSLLMVATDRLSAFDVVFAQGIPHKGAVLTQLSLFWFDYLHDVVENHVLSGKIPSSLKKFESLLAGRSLVIKKARPLPVECVVRGYLSGSGWKDYRKNGSICGIPLPAGLRESEKLPEPIFTPSTKAEVGHDENIGFEHVVKTMGEKTTNQLRDLSLKLYMKGAAHAEKRGIILADTKFEFGMLGNKLILIDEVLTPDSSRFWPADKYSPGRPQPSFDKQYVRDYLEGIGWNKKPPAPLLPEKIIEGTSKRYIEAYEKITGKMFEK
ncbi:MAG: phosphoribosylaminoimidazolesuccinocarboxamide synthase [Candidatus Burarchaeum sp.]|nr:phosphoribosylaminoimidazolesuccinocarboxamide synthase [Candidatus Burarchaeum sp.]MDO8339831.1 phosphoribosylaminoimidazolesuccinocarboxamide synthase [Candidatus Burarchaeum sp.]